MKTEHDQGFIYTIRICGLALVVILLAGCSLAPTYARPDASLPGAYAQTDKTLAEFATVNRDWWKQFNSKALPALQETALANNHAFEAERWVLAQAFSRARAARSSLFPSLDASGSGSRRGSANAGGYKVTDSVSGTLQASYEVDLWGANREGANAQEHTALAGMNAWRGAGLSLESEVALTYFSYLAARENLAVYDSMLKNAQEVLSYQEKREKLGAAAPLDVTRQRSSVESMKASRIGYEIKMTEARNSLCLLLGTADMPENLAALMEGEKLRAIAPVSVTPGIPDDLLTRRPDITQLEERLKAANANIGVARAAFLPGISLTGSAGWQSDSLSTLISPASALYSVAGSLLAPIFNNGKNIAKYDESIAAKNELIERYRQGVLNAYWEVSTALSGNELLAQQEKHRKASAAQATEAYRIARLRYAEGAEDFLAVLNAQETMLSADNSMIQTRLERLNTAVTLFKALGGGWASEGNPDAMRKELSTAPALTL